MYDQVDHSAATGRSAMKMERRVRRSHHTGLALSMQLQACAERSGVDAMILADGNGLVVASSEWNDDATEHVAAQLSSVSTHQFRVLTLQGAGMTRTVAARGFRVGDQELVVGAVGRPTQDIVGEMYTAMGGVSRILAA